jgi:hypothetical protein
MRKVILAAVLLAGVSPAVAQWDEDGNPTPQPYPQECCDARNGYNWAQTPQFNPYQQQQQFNPYYPYPNYNQ